MTAKVFSFDAAKRLKTQPKTKTTAPKPKTTQEIFEDVYGDIIDEWQAHAVSNALNEFIRKKIPVHARGLAEADFVGDLNVIALVESKLGMRVVMASPEVEGTKGWVVSFRHEDQMFTAPPIMASETYARALSILLYVEMLSRLKKLKRL